MQTKKHEILDGVFPKKGLYLGRFSQRSSDIFDLGGAP